MTQPKQQIIALGGGGFPMEPENLLLDRYILEQSPHQTPKACFLTTANGDNDNNTRRFYDAYIQIDCRPCHLRLFFLTTGGLNAFIKEQDVIYVDGGSTFNLLVL